MGEVVTVPVSDCDRLCAATEDPAALRACDRTKAVLVAGEDELIPDACLDRLLDGENSLRAYRELRGLTQAARPR